MRAHQIIFYMLNVTRLFIKHYYSRGLLFMVQYRMVYFLFLSLILSMLTHRLATVTVGLLCAAFSVKFLTVSTKVSK